jgi:HSP20 family protein
MALIRWYDRGLEPTEPFDWLQRQINELFDLPRTSGSEGVFDRAASPLLDVVELPESFVVECDLPGVAKDALDISWDGSFQRTLSLPAGVDAARVEASFKDGVLTVTIPKKEEAKARRIDLKSD